MFINRVLALLIGYIVLQVIRQPRHTGPLYKYSYCSFSNIMSSWFQYEALKFVSFPTQVLCKASKVCWHDSPSRSVCVSCNSLVSGEVTQVLNPHFGWSLILAFRLFSKAIKANPYLMALTSTADFESYHWDSQKFTEIQEVLYFHETLDIFVCHLWLYIMYDTCTMYLTIGLWTGRRLSAKLE